jgi:ZU5 domain
MNLSLRMTPWMGALCCGLALALSACGDGGGSAPPPPLAPSVGPAGGTVTGPNGAQVVIPAGALAAQTPIAVEQSSAGAPATPAGMTGFGAMFAFTPHGTSFAVPVTVTVPFNAAAVPAGATPVLYKTNGTGAWERVANATVNAGTVTAQVSSFSWFIVGNVPPIITTQPASVSVVEPATASFSVVAGVV